MNATFLRRKRSVWAASSAVFALASSGALLLLMTIVLLTRFENMAKAEGLMSESRASAILGGYWQIVIALCVLMLIALGVSFGTASERGPDGAVTLFPLDRIWMEVQAVAAIIVSCAVAPVYYLLGGWLLRSAFWKHFLNMTVVPGMMEELKERASAYFLYEFATSFDPPWIQLFFAAVITVFVAALDLLVLESFFRKVRARAFWKYSLLGILFVKGREGWKTLRVLYRSVRKGYRFLTVAIIGIIAVAAILCSWSPFFAAVSIAASMLLVPRVIGRFIEIRNGASMIRSGHLDYKIPFLGSGEFGQLAEDLNSIADSQNLAIQNELRNQRLKTELISNVSHDLRTPLTSMVTYVDLLKTEGLDSENAPEYLAILEEKTERLRKLTDDLFEAAKASSGTIPVELEIIDMAAILNQALAELEENLKKSDLNIITSISTENTFVMADGKLLWRVMENLLTNVSKYALPGSRIYCNLSNTGDMVRFEMKNISKDPLNIPAEELMERFMRGDDSRNTEGSGLGLAIARDLVNLMGGKFDIVIDGDLFKAIVELKR